MSFQRFLQDWAQPAAIGLAMAAAMLLLFPQLRGTPEGGVGTHERQGPVSYAQAVNRAGPAVVNIYTRQREIRRRHPLFDDPLFRQLFDSMNLPQRERMQSNLGSGVIVSDEGYVLTNHHVVAQAESIVVVLADGREAQAKLVGSDEDFDLAVLRIDLPSLTAIEVGEPEKAQVGDVVLAIGNPFGVGQTVTQGIISATGRYLENGGSGSYLQNFLQTDAAVNPGNSGGALVDASGRLLGINTRILNQTSGHSGGISFAIPANIALKVMRDLIEFGQVVPGWLGIDAQPVTPELARSFGLDAAFGVVVTGTHRDGPAHSAGLQPGDIITHIDGIAINDGKGGVVPMAAMATLRPGDVVSITFLRQGETRTIRATVAERPQAERRS